MIEIVPFKPEHAARIRLQARQQEEKFYDPVVYIRVGESFTGMLDGEIIFCAGRAYGRGVWTMLSCEARRHMVAVTRSMRYLLSLAGECELEAIVLADFPEARRWAEMFGFRFKEHDPEFGDIYVRPA